MEARPYSETIYRGASWILGFVYRDIATQAPIDLTGYVVEVTVRNAAGTIVFEASSDDESSALTITDAAGGAFALHVPDETTETWAWGSGNLKFWMVSPDGDRWPMTDGTLAVKR